MRERLLAAGLFGVLGATGCGSAAGAEPVALKCEPGTAAIAALCDAIRNELVQRGHRIDTDRAGTELVLTANAPRVDIIWARLDVIRDGTRHRGEQGELSVMDRADLPPQQLEFFARALIDRAGAPLR
ncbi:hypothetical protein [Paracoccus laeviglucosivorans]|uniref:Lipoprotein n=1 Tax=Paracoccus laeviglucosivorans TaxID=1197861 RepID=A0A521DA09_9RHOB|nr:hypothetical protein [Paracoccus laeviglucosivorans]SMO68549.1 hypothetical protein SAMN06265221_10744 [Paracoccus laeviglucosivorans]